MKAYPNFYEYHGNARKNEWDLYMMQLYTCMPYVFIVLSFQNMELTSSVD